MLKFILIVCLIGFLFYILYNRFIKPNLKGNDGKIIQNNGYLLIDTTHTIISKATNLTLTTVGIGFILLIIVLVLAIKIKILLFLLPISFYLIGQLFLLSNHVKTTKKQQIWFNPQNSAVFIEQIDAENINFNLLNDVRRVREVKSVQNTRGLFFGYYELILSHDTIQIPYLVAENPQNKLFLETLHANFKIAVESKLFPII
ncbi:hypothetical protein [Sphingobacterium hungaricum]|uniref:hypothetical protein n=1 Tax=Sphingobacterium hungaricum TaxID=2082723 RepID=UPI0018C96095|nr:hypothetical protein [Sphingobacterium hungaricum]